MSAAPSPLSPAPHVAVTPAQLRIVNGILWLEGDLCRWPSAAAVAALLCLTHSTVVRHLQKLRRIGVVARSSTRVIRPPTGVMLDWRQGGWSA